MSEKYFCATCIHAGKGGVIPGLGLCLQPRMFEYNMSATGKGPSRVFARLVCNGNYWEGADGSKRPHWTEELYGPS